MSVSVKISSSDKRNFEKDLGEYLKKVDLSKGRALRTLGFNIRGQAMKILDSQKTTDTGVLKNSIKVSKVVDDSVNIETTSGYGLYVEFGRGPGKPPKYADLIDWVRRKKISGTYSIKTRRRSRAGGKSVMAKQDISAAIAIARAIGKRGTKAQPFLKPAFEREKRKIILELRKEIAKIK